MLNKTSIFALLIVLLLSISSGLSAQSRWRPQLQEPHFTRLGAAEGLSQSGVNCILHDSRGYMWFGTQDGLNRYDGYNFTVFKHVPGDSLSISHNWIWTLHEDQRGNLWIGTFGGGLNRFDRATGRFTVYRQKAEASDIVDINSPRSITQQQPGKIWMGLDVGFAGFDMTTGQFSHYQPTEQRNYLEIHPDGNGGLLLMLAQAMGRFDPVTESYHEEKFSFSPERASQQITTVSRRRAGGYWLASDQGEVFIYLPAQKLLKKVAEGDSAAPYAGKSVNSLLEDSDGILWVGTSAGIYLLSADSGSYIRRLQFEADKPHGISHNLISTIYENRHREIWVGTRMGLNMFSRTLQKFNHLTSDKNAPATSLSSPHVLPIYEDDQQRIWVGTGNGLNLFDPDRNQFKHYFFGEPGKAATSGDNYILSIYQDTTSALWLGTRGSGARRFQPDHGKSRRFTLTRDWKTSASYRNINSIYRTTDGSLWLGGGGGGLNLYQPDSQTFLPYQRRAGDSTSISNNWIFAMLEDHEKRFWLGTAAGGLNLFDREKQVFRHFLHDPADPSSLSSNMVLCIFQAADSSLWIGTANGLNRMTVDRLADGIQCRFKSFYENDGLPNNVIYGILEDDRQRLWISTNRGITRMTRTSGSPQFRNYSERDGLQSDEFNQNAWLHASDGRFYFGGINGLNWFYPDSISDNPFLPPVVISNFSIFNERVPLAGVSAQQGHIQTPTRLDVVISETRQINLSWRDEVFSFEFAALNFSEPSQNQYAYMMEGFDREWIYSGSRRFVTYTNLDPGNYVFRVKASNNDGIWNRRGTSIDISIAPPPWRTWWAYLLYALLFSAVIGALVRFQMRRNAVKIETLARIERARIEERERVRKQSSADFHDEAGNLITRINLYLELTRRGITDKSPVAEYLDHIEENTKSLSGGMRDFIWVLDPEQDSLFDTIGRLQQFGNSMFTDSDAHFTVQGQEARLKDMNLPPKDRRAIVLIFKEAMNNSLKYARAGRIQLAVTWVADVVSITLQDDGIGFGELSAGGYGLSNMRTRAEKIEADLDIKSTPGVGTFVKFCKFYGAGD